MAVRMKPVLAISLALFGLGSLGKYLHVPPRPRGPVAAAAAVKPLDPRGRIVHWLDYVALDYPEAVADGRIADDEEYEEQLEFLGKAIALHAALADSRGLPQLVLLRGAVERCAAPEEIARLVEAFKHEYAADDAGVSAAHAAAQAECLACGREAYERNCMQCHGPDGYGNGPAAAMLHPRPADFHDGERMAKLSPVKVFHTIRFGIDGTAMPPFAERLSEAEIWQLAQYILSLRETAHKEES